MNKPPLVLAALALVSLGSPTAAQERCTAAPGAVRAVISPSSYAPRRAVRTRAARASHTSYAARRSGRWALQWVPAVERLRRDACGRLVRVVVVPGHYRRVWRPARTRVGCR